MACTPERSTDKYLKHSTGKYEREQLCDRHEERLALAGPFNLNALKIVQESAKLSFSEAIGRFLPEHSAKQPAKKKVHTAGRLPFFWPAQCPYTARACDLLECSLCRIPGTFMLFTVCVCSHAGQLAHRLARLAARGLVAHPLRRQQGRQVRASHGHL